MGGSPQPSVKNRRFLTRALAALSCCFDLRSTTRGLGTPNPLPIRERIWGGPFPPQPCGGERACFFFVRMLRPASPNPGLAGPLRLRSIGRGPVFFDPLLRSEGEGASPFVSFLFLRLLLDPYDQGESLRIKKHKKGLQINYKNILL